MVVVIKRQYFGDISPQNHFHLSKIIAGEMLFNCLQTVIANIVFSIRSKLISSSFDLS